MKHAPIGEIFIGRKNSQFFKMLEVTAQSTPNKTVHISSGNYFRNRNEIVEFDNQDTPELNFPQSGSKFVIITINRNNVLEIVNGEESLSTPQVPQFEESSLPLALIHITSQNTVITQDMIYDIKPYLNIPGDTAINKSYWYNYNINNTKNIIINSDSILISKQSGSNGFSETVVDGVIHNTYCIYNMAFGSGSISLSAKSNFERNKNDIIKWDYDFIKNSTNTHANAEDFTVTSSPTVRSFYNYGYTLIKLKYPDSFTTGNVITAQLGSDVLGTIDNKSGYIEYLSNAGSVETNITFTQSITDSDTILSITDYYLDSFSDSNVQNATTLIANFGSFPFYGMGKYKVFAITPFSNASETIEFYVGGVLVGTMSTNNKSILLDFSTLELNSANIEVVCNNFTTLGGTFEFVSTRLNGYSTYGNNPQVLVNDDCVIISISNLSNSKSGIMTLTPKLYDENLNLIKSNDSIHIVMDLYDSGSWC